MKHLFQNIVEIKKALGLSIHFTSQNEFSLSYCILYKEKGLINIGEFGEIESFASLTEIATDLPIFVNVSGKLIIEKIIDSSENKKYIQAVFPNNSNDDFLFQVLEQNEKTLVSLVRKDKADLIVSEMRASGLSPISLALGLASSSFGINAIDNYDSEGLNLFGAQVNFSNSEIVSFSECQTDSETITIESKHFTDAQFMAFSVAMNAFYDEDEQINTLDYLTLEKQDQLHKNIFDKLKLAVPAFFLIILLINFLFYSQYLSENNKLSSADLQNNGIIESLDKLKEEIESKEKFLKKSNWLAQSKVSYYSDQIGLLIPKQIGLTILDVFPATLIKKNNTKSYTFNKEIIKIEGVSESLQSVNDWKQILQNQDWINDVELTSYVQDGKGKEISFELKLSLF